ncbi:MAG: hypothetical protein NBV66_00855 [Burkholderiaceae bacterium]|nr:hypothetical protein [Burkholderiaceae bacterium]
MSTFILFLSTFGLISFISQQAEIGRYKAPFIFCCSVSLVLFFFALFDLLSLGLILATALGCFLAILQIIRIARNPKYINAHYSDVLILVPFLIFYLAVATDFKFLIWDEFSFWASSTKIIYETNALFKNDSPIFLKSYPPIQQLFQYFFVKQTFWSEKNVLYAQTFWVLSSILCVVGSIVRGQLNISLTFIIATSFLYFFNYSYSTIYSDQLLGVCFAACLALAYDQHKKTTTAVVFFISIAALALIKEIAILLALVAFGVFYVSYFIENQSSNKSLKARLLYPTLVSLLGLSATIGVLKSWSWYVATIQATRDVVIPNFSIFTDPALSKRLSLTTSEFFTRVLKPGFLSISDRWSIPSPSLLFIFIIFILLSVSVVLIKPRILHTKLVLTLSIIFVGALGYLAALFVSYLVFFTEYEGIRLASFERYFSSYILAWMLLLFAFLCSAIDELKTKSLVTAHVVIGLFICLLIPSVFFKEVRVIEAGGEAYQLRQRTESFADKVKKYIQPNEKVYFIAQNSNGLERIMFYYAMLPYTSSMSWCWSIGKKYFEGDVWSCEVNLPSLLDGYEYLAVYRSDEKLWQSGGTLFDTGSIKNGSPSLFRINRKDGKIESFSRLE